MSEDEAPFQVGEEIVVGDLTEVKELRQIMPPCQNVKVRISKCGIQQSKDKDITALKLELRIVDGIEITNPETGETKLAYINKPMFTGLMDVIVSADLAVKGRMEKAWWRNRQYLVGLKKFCQAVGLDTTNLKVNDALFETLVGKELLIDIKHEEETSMDPSSGERVKLGTYRERVANFKRAM